MNLYLQIFSLLFSFFYGVLFSFLIKISHVFLFHVNTYIKVWSSFLFILIMSLIYFFSLYVINGGIIHFYFLLIFVCGWYLGYLFVVKLSKK